jgi:hypothetical protein
MKKSSILFAILALVLASVACNTLLGGDSNAPEISPPIENSGEQSQPEQNNNSGGGASGATSEFLLPDSATNPQWMNGMTSYQAEMTLDEAMTFYRDTFSQSGYTERAILTVTSETTFSMVFDGHESGQAIVVQGVDLGNGMVNISVRLEDV